MNWIFCSIFKRPKPWPVDRAAATAEIDQFQIPITERNPSVHRGEASLRAEAVRVGSEGPVRMNAMAPQLRCSMGYTHRDAASSDLQRIRLFEAHGLAAMMTTHSETHHA